MAILSAKTASPPDRHNRLYVSTVTSELPGGASSGRLNRAGAVSITATPNGTTSTATNNHCRRPSANGNSTNAGSSIRCSMLLMSAIPLKISPSRMCNARNPLRLMP